MKNNRNRVSRGSEVRCRAAGGGPSCLCQLLRLRASAACGRHPRSLPVVTSPPRLCEKEEGLSAFRSWGRTPRRHFGPLVHPGGLLGQDSPSGLHSVRGPFPPEVAGGRSRRRCPHRIPRLRPGCTCTSPPGSAHRTASRGASDLASPPSGPPPPLTKTGHRRVMWGSGA